MAGIFDVLSDDEVRQIGALVEKLEKSRFDFLQLDVGGVKLTIGKGDAPPLTAAGEAPRAVAPLVAAPVVTAAPAPAPAPAAPEKTPAALQVDDGTLAITAPMMGRFYTQPEPDATPFVSVGGQVGVGTTVGLIEVMKVFTAVASGQTGIVTEICVKDSDFVEYGQVLFRVRPQS